MHTFGVIIKASGMANCSIMIQKKTNNYTLQCTYMITKWIYDILISDKIGIYLPGVSFVAQYSIKVNVIGIWWGQILTLKK